MVPTEDLNFGVSIKTTFRYKTNLRRTLESEPQGEVPLRLERVPISLESQVQGTVPVCFFLMQ